MMKCLIVDDEEMAVKVIENHISHIQGLEVAGMFHNAIEAFTALQQQQVDLLFLDIQMPKMDGLTLLKSLPWKPKVILTTAHRNFALEGYELDVVDYLLKPIAFDRFLKAVGKAFRQHNDSSPPLAISSPPPPAAEPAPFFYIKSERQYQKVLLDEILYIESLRNHVRIVTLQENIISLMGISQVAEKLPPQRFLRIHRSFIVSLARVSRFSQTQLRVGEKDLPIGNHYRKEVLHRLEQDAI